MTVGKIRVHVPQTLRDVDADAAATPNRDDVAAGTADAPSPSALEQPRPRGRLSVFLPFGPSKGVLALSFRSHLVPSTRRPLLPPCPFIALIFRPKCAISPASVCGDGSGGGGGCGGGGNRHKRVCTGGVAHLSPPLCAKQSTAAGRPGGRLGGHAVCTGGWRVGGGTAGRGCPSPRAPGALRR